jgi:hypothetical protein
MIRWNLQGVYNPDGGFRIYGLNYGVWILGRGIARATLEPEKGWAVFV